MPAEPPGSGGWWQSHCWPSLPDHTTAVVKECVGVDIARVRGVIKLRGVVCRLRVSIVIEVD